MVGCRGEGEWGIGRPRKAKWRNLEFNLWPLLSLGTEDDGHYLWKVSSGAVRISHGPWLRALDASLPQFNAS